jgi:uncharacterized repeat protein (TIGR03803 family)
MQREGNFMRHKKFWFRMSGILAVLAVGLMLPTGAVAGTKYKVLHRFTDGNDGGTPTSLIFDADGNLYGTAETGGTSGMGTVFKLTPNSDGSWTESVLYSFCSLTNCADGASPSGTLIFDAAGNLYGTTQLGGASGYGTVFELTPKSDGSWTESVLHSFRGGADGFQPLDGVIFDAAENLYGLTISGGSSNRGTVFKLTPNSDGTWTERVLYSFCSLAKCADGDTPYYNLIFDKAGNLYGTASSGGGVSCSGHGCGVVFELTPHSDGSWTESVLYSFRGGTDGAYPFAGLIFDGTGSLYGTTPSGGNLSDCINGCGVVFKLTPNSHGRWTESVLHSFANHPASNPYAGLIFDATGNLYSTTFYGGPVNGGVVFKMAPKSDGSWAFSVLHVFLGKPAEGPSTFSSPVLDNAGHLFAATAFCASGQCAGVVFEVTP